MRKKAIMLICIMVILSSFVSAQWIRPDGGSDNFFYFFGFSVFNDPYFINISNVISFNETKLNTTIDARASSISDTNESVRVNNIVSTNCTGQVVAGFYSNGSGFCEADNTGGVGGGGDRWNILGPYLYNNSGSLDLNETKLNESIEELDSTNSYTAGTGLSLSGTVFSLLWRDLDNFTNKAGYYNTEGNLTSLLNDNYLGLTDQRYNETLYVDAVNTTANIVSLGFSTGSHTTDTNTRWLVNESIFINNTNTLNLNESAINITEAQITDLTHTVDTDTNESVRFNNLVNNECSTGNFIYNFSQDGTPRCDAPAGSGDITAVRTKDLYIYNGSESGDVQLLFNETKLNATIDARATGTTFTDLDTDYPNQTITTNYSFNQIANHEWSPQTADLHIGNGVEGQIKLGNMWIGQADDTIAGTVLDDIYILYNDAQELVENISYIFFGPSDVPRFVLSKEGPDLATYNPRSMVIGPSATIGNVDENVQCSTNFNHIDCNTGVTGADLGVQDDIEAGGKIWAGDWSNVSITESQIIDLTHTSDTQIVTDTNYNSSVFRNEGGNLGIVWTLFTSFFQSITQSNANNNTLKAEIDTKLAITDQRYNDTIRVNSVNNSLQSQITQQLTDNGTLATRITTNEGDISDLIASNTTQDNLFYDSSENAVFLTVDTGEGANDLFDMNQNVLTTSDVTFDDITATKNVSIGDNITFANSNFTIQANNTCGIFKFMTTTVEVCK